MNVEFSKYHGLANDFLIVYEQEVTAELARFMCERHTGIGADGVIRLTKSDIADFSFELFNADGSRAEVSGNGLRCVAKFVYEKGLHKESTLKVEAAGDIKILDLDIDEGAVLSVRADMGVPVEEGEIELLGRNWKLISTGNPHAVTFLNEIETAPVGELGPQVEHDPHFPNRTNVEFVEQVGDILHVRFWERGVGITMASGTGSCAAAVASKLPRATVRTLGGDLMIERGEGGRVFMSGPATHVFDGGLA